MKIPTPLYSFLLGLLTGLLVICMVLAVLGVIYGALRPVFGLLVAAACGVNAMMGVCAFVWYFNPTPYSKG